jgi:hypothetical protein
VAGDLIRRADADGMSIDAAKAAGTADRSRAASSVERSTA